MKHRSLGVQEHRPLRVLVIEDDDELRAFYRCLLEDGGLQVHLARDGAEGLRQLDWHPDLILLDLMLPGMDGYQFLRRLRTTPEGRGVAVVVLSAAMPPGRMTVSGAQAVLRKPFDADQLMRTIDLYGHRMH